MVSVRFKFSPASKFAPLIKILPPTISCRLPFVGEIKFIMNYEEFLVFNAKLAIRLLGDPDSTRDIKSTVVGSSARTGCSEPNIHLTAGNQEGKHGTERRTVTTRYYTSRINTARHQTENFILLGTCAHYLCSIHNCLAVVLTKFTSSSGQANRELPMCVPIMHKYSLGKITSRSFLEARSSGKDRELGFGVPLIEQIDILVSFFEE